MNKSMRESILKSWVVVDVGFALTREVLVPSSFGGRVFDALGFRGFGSLCVLLKCFVGV